MIFGVFEGYFAEVSKILEKGGAPGLAGEPGGLRICWVEVVIVAITPVPHYT